MTTNDFLTSGELQFIDPNVFGTLPLLLKITASADLYMGAPRMVVWVDGKMVADVEVSANRSNGDSEKFIFEVPSATRAENVRIQFSNDQYGGTVGLDRNLWIESLEVNGVTISPTSTKPSSTPQAFMMGKNSTITFNTADILPRIASVVPEIISDTHSAAAPGKVSFIAGEEIVVRASGDSYKGDASFSLYVDGKNMGTVSVGASHQKGDWKDYAFKVPVGTTFSKIEIRFENDMGDSGGDRNLYVDHINVLGIRHEPSESTYLRNSKTSIGGQNAMLWGGKLEFSLPSQTVSVPVPVKQESLDEIVVRASGDSYKGDASFSLYVDGKKIGSASVDASHQKGEWKDYVFKVSPGTTFSKMEIRFENDMGDSGGDRNLYVEYVKVLGNRHEVVSSTYERTSKASIVGQSSMLWGGKLAFSLPTQTVPSDQIPPPPPSTGGNPPPTSGTVPVSIKVAGDAGSGINAKFDLFVNDVKVASDVSVSALKSSGQWQTLTFQAPPGTSTSSKFEIKFTNDGGSGTQDRNLYVDYLEVGGVRLETESGIYRRDSGTEIKGQDSMLWAGSLLLGKTTLPAGISVAEVVAKTAVVKAPELTEASHAGEIVSFRLRNDSAETEKGQVSFGHVFKEGDLKSGQKMVAVLNGKQYAVQIDTKATYADGSIKHAILTVDHPDVMSGQNIEFMFKTSVSGPSGKSISVSDVLARGYDVDVTIDLKNPDGTVSKIVVDAASVLAEAMSKGQVETWMNGPLASEFRVVKKINDHLDVTFDIRAFKDGSIKTDVIMGAQSTFMSGIQKTYNYDVKIMDSGKEVFSDSVNHYRNTTWHKEVWNVKSPEPFVVYDVAYMSKTGAVSAYDTSMGVQAGSFSLPSSADVGPMGNAMVYKKMSDVGGRSDIGIMPAWDVRYLISQDPKAYKTMLANADASGSIPWHYIDEKTGEYVRIDDHPKLWFDGRQGSGPDKLANGWDNGYGAGWEMDVSHQPNLNYLSYLVSGSQYYLDGLIAETGYVLAAISPDYRGFARGLIDSGQVRGRSWGLRDLSDSAYITPDDHAMKSYFQKYLDVNLDNMVERYVNGSLHNKYGEIEGFFRHEMWPDGDLLVWQSDFMALVMAQAAQRGSSQASQIVEWMDSFASGRFISEDKGFDPRFGASYILKVNSSGNGPAYDTWEELFKGSFGSKPTPSSEGISGTPSSPYGYAANAKAAMAAIFNAISSPDALEAFGFLTKYMVNASGANGQIYDPTWNVAPIMADGSILGYDSVKIAKSAAGVTFKGESLSELVHGHVGPDVLDGGDGIDVLFGDSGNDMLYGGDGNDFLFGGKGNDVVSGGKGNDYLKGNAGNDIFSFRSDSGGRDTIADFQKGSDLIEIQAKLNGSSISTAKQAAAAAVSDGNGGTVIKFGIGMEINILGLSPDKISADMFHIV